MVNALQGVLLACDIPSKEYILRLNEEKSKNEKFLLEELDDTHLFVKHIAVEELQRKLKEFQEQNTYEIPRREHTETMAEVTVAFQVCSETINSAETGLRNIEQFDMADMLRVVQTNEQEKLRLTLIVQALRQSHSLKNFSWNSAPSVHTVLTDSDAGMPSHACHCCTAAEPTEAEFLAAKAEALQGLQVVIDNINEVLEEVKYAEAELDE